MKTIILLLPLLLSIYSCGKNGSPGAKGDPGQSTTSEKICIETNSSINGVGISFFYENIGFSNGDHLIICSVSGGIATFSGTYYWKPANSGLSKGQCLVGADVDPVASGGYWSLTSIDGINKVIYVDPGSPDDQKTFTFAAASCKDY